MTNNVARPLAMAALVLTLGVGMSGCSTMADLDPTGLLSDDDASAPDTQFPTDSNQQAQADANTTTPDLAAIPTRPAAPDTQAQASATAQTQAAGAQAQYSAEALRAGTEAAAPPPVATDATATRQALATANAAPSASEVPPGAADAPPTAGSAAANETPPSASAPAAAPAEAPPPARVASAAPPPSVTPEAAVPEPAAPVAAPPVTAAPPPVSPAAPAPVASAPIAPPPGAEPAVPAVPMTPGARMAMVNPTDAQLGFKPSSAPALNPSVAQWVSPAILARYRQTASAAGVAGTGRPAVPAVPASGKSGVGSRAGAGDVIANLNAVPGTPAGMAAANNGGVAPTAIVYFSGDGTTLPASARAQVRDAAAAFKALGGTASIKVVGHASSRTANMSVERHLEVIFQKSQARANTVAQALIKAGVPASKVQIEAVGDSQPIYYESMPKGEDGNRRAEIFVQG